MGDENFLEFKDGRAVSHPVNDVSEKDVEMDAREGASHSGQWVESTQCCNSPQIEEIDTDEDNTGVAPYDVCVQCGTVFR